MDPTIQDLEKKIEAGFNGVNQKLTAFGRILKKMLEEQSPPEKRWNNVAASKNQERGKKVAIGDIGSSHECRAVFQQDQETDVQICGRPCETDFGMGTQKSSSGRGSSDNNIGVKRTRHDDTLLDHRDIIKEIAPIMRSIRRILLHPGYNDGDPLSADDQTYMLQNVFNHHPEKDRIMACPGVYYVMMVRSHMKLHGTPHFYVVSASDGHKQAFSCRACIENLIRSKYPGKAEDFISKYFCGGPRPGPVEARTSLEWRAVGEDHRVPSTWLHL